MPSLSSSTSDHDSYEKMAADGGRPGEHGDTAAQLVDALIVADHETEDDDPARTGTPRRRRRAKPPSATSQRVLTALIKAGRPIEIQEISRLSQLTPYELSWRLVRMVQYDDISRERVRDAKLGDRYFYYLSPVQKAAALDVVDVNLRVEPREMPLIESTKKILKALLLANNEITAEEVANIAVIKTSEAVWRLHCLARLDVVARRRKNVASPWRYFLRKDQRSYAENATIHEAEALQDSLKTTRATKRELKQSLSTLNAQLQQDLQDIKRIRAELAEKAAAESEAGSEKEQLERRRSRLLARAQSSPIALSERHAFLERLLARPALGAEKMLHEIAQDYLRALSIARGS